MLSSICRLITIALLGLFLSLGLANYQGLLINAQTPLISLIEPVSKEEIPQERQGQDFYEKGQNYQAIPLWQEAVQVYQTQGDNLRQARILSNLALAYQQVGRWEEAQQAIATSFKLLDSASSLTTDTLRLPILAQTWNNQGVLYLAQGEPEQALASWKKSLAIYGQIHDNLGITRSQINQGRALQALGLYPRACNLLLEALNIPSPTCRELTPEILEKSLKALPNSLNSVANSGWRSLADGLRSVSKLEESQLILENLLKRTTPGEKSAKLLLSLAKTIQVSGDKQTAWQLSQQATKEAQFPKTQLEAQLAQFNLALDLEQWQEAKQKIPLIITNLEQLPLSRLKIDSQINFAEHLSQLKAETDIEMSWSEITQLLIQANQQAQKLGNNRSQAYALGSLGKVYYQTQQLKSAQEFTEKALLLSQAINAPEITYRWQWQLGKIFQAQGEYNQAIFSYEEAINNLKSISGDLAANPEAQSSFQESVEPVYREFVNLLLKPNAQGIIPQTNLRQARDTIEALQLAELNNFFREACLEVKPKQIDQIDPQAAVIYPIILSDRLAVILSLPQQPLTYYETPLAGKDLKATLEKLRYTLVIRSKRDFLAPAQQIYDWLLRQAEPELAKSGVTKLVFVLDGELRNIPMAVLHDGNKYLIENYQIALTSGLQLLSPKQIQEKGLHTLLAGLSKANQGLAPLAYVTQEFEQIQAKVSSEVLINEQFTTEKFQKAIEFSAFPIVHIATHGQFSSNFEDTFIVTWDSFLDIRQLDNLLQARNPSIDRAIELLVLSACETATGDKRAALGLAGMAVKAGARSTLATLWSVNDQATSELMSQFYGQLANQKATKGEAIRQAQLTLLKSRWYQHPFYWAAYVLVGNWL